MSKAAKSEGAPAMDWRDVGRQLQQEEERFGKAMDAIEDRDETEWGGQFVRALYAAARGDNAPILECLRGDRPLPEFWRINLRAYFRGDFSRGRGQPRDELSHLAARDALNFYRWWRRENERLGVKDFGHREEMKDTAVNFVLGREPVFKDVDPLKVRDLMNRPRSRRK